MQPIVPVKQQEAIEAGYREEYHGGWGWLILLLAFAAVLVAAVMFFSSGDAAGEPGAPVPSDVPVDPGY